MVDSVTGPRGRLVPLPSTERRRILESLLHANLAKHNKRQVYLSRCETFAMYLKGVPRANRLPLGSGHPGHLGHTSHSRGAPSAMSNVSTELQTMEQLGLCLRKNVRAVLTAKPAAQYSRMTPRSSAMNVRSQLRYMRLKYAATPYASLAFTPADSAAIMQKSSRRRNFLGRFVVGRTGHPSGAGTPTTSSNEAPNLSNGVSADANTSMPLYGLTGATAAITPKHLDLLHRILSQLFEDLLLKLGMFSFLFFFATVILFASATFWTAYWQYFFPPLIQFLSDRQTGQLPRIPLNL